jgi:hypothetical protein
MALAGLPPDTELQHLTQALGPTYGYSVLPKPVHLAALMPLIASDTLDSASEDQRIAGYAALTQVENPELESPDTADCVSCHVANFIRGYVDENYPPSVAPETTYSELAAATRVVGEAETDVSNLRAFGYFATGPSSVSPAVSQRTANETHRVLELFEAL